MASAFDKVWHFGLIAKMIDCNIPSGIIHWVSNFLNKRYFCVKVNNYQTDCKPISCGVPQGGVLSPLLFSIFINDVPLDWVQNKSISALFADDICHLEIYRDEKIASKRINHKLAKLQTWMTKWRLSMAIHKCTYTILHDQKFKPPDLDLTMNGKSIVRTLEATLLGVTIDQKLNFVSHLKNIEDKCSDRLNLIHILSNKSWGINQTTLLSLFNSLVRSTFEYSSILLPHLSQTFLSRLQCIQNSALRSILNLHYNKVLKKNTKVETLHQLSSLPLVADRLQDLGLKYLGNAIINDNPIIKKCGMEYIESIKHRKQHIPTLFNICLK